MNHTDKQGRPQHARFLETARALGADEDPATFRAALGKVGRHKPKGEVPEATEEPKVAGGRRKPV